MRIKSCLFGILMIIIGLYACDNTSKREFVEVGEEIVQEPEDVVFGNDTASHSVFLYASYNCKYCRFLFSRTIPKLKEKYLDKNTVKVVVKFVELSENADSFYALNAAGCIYRFGQYEKFHELLLANPAVVITDDFYSLVDDIMSENPDIAQCITENQDYSYLKKNIKDFRNFKFTGTPTMVINNHAYSGYISFENLDKIIEREFNF